ncbi:MAG: hypothetical protein FJ290_22965 [Planctomycetes bacterium]|nr:hypothetical protein [Planctomycetota bacterium]
MVRRVFIAFAGALALGLPCGCKAPEGGKAAAAGLTLCGKCGQVKGSALCCLPGATACSKCGLTKGAPGCCKIQKGPDVPLCGKCGQIKGTDLCCKPGQPVCAKCGCAKGSPACCVVIK